MKRKLNRLGEWAHQNLGEAQEGQRNRYDSKIQPREFEPGEKVLLLLPSSDTKLVTRWQGPYEVTRRIGPVDYEIQTPDKRAELKVFHVNLGWFAPGKNWDPVAERSMEKPRSYQRGRS